MCGIVGYSGTKHAKGIIYNGLKQLEYRGYDSAGVTVLDPSDKFHTRKSVGTVSELDLSFLPDEAYVGIGHTRWATHGGVTDVNAHPHQYGSIALVHNGIIENYEQLAKKYELKPVSQTDSEVLAGVIDHYMKEKKNLKNATLAALAEVQGTYGILVISTETPKVMIAARKGSPLIIGIGQDEHIFASDPQAILSHTDAVIFLEDGEIAVLENNNLTVVNLANQPQTKVAEEVEMHEAVDMAGYASFMEKEIHEQPRSLMEVMRGRTSPDGKVKLGGPNLTIEEIRNLETIIIIGAGTAYYAGYYAKYELEELLDIPIHVEHASEFRYRHAAFNSDRSLVIFMSQSGETADTLAALAEAKRRGAATMGIVNTVGSSLARSVTHGGIYLHAGTEVSVASTKAYSSMVVALLMLGAYFADQRGQKMEDIRNIVTGLNEVPAEISTCLNLSEQIEAIAAQILRFENCFVLGRGTLHAVALEGALKITEVTYIHAQAFPTGEMKHGPISLVDENHLSIVMLPEDKLLYDKSISGIQELKARNGKILSLSSRPSPQQSDWHITVPMVNSSVSGLVMNCCLQLLALHLAQKLGRNTDRPRNLAKSVTVE